MSDEERAASVLDTLMRHGLDQRTAHPLVPSLVDWFDGMSVGLAEAMVPHLVAAVRAAVLSSAAQRFAEAIREERQKIVTDRPNDWQFGIRTGLGRAAALLEHIDLAGGL